MADNGSEGYQVHHGDLTAHAKTVQQVASQLDQALSAATQVTMGVQAYGLICGPLFVPMVLAVSTPGLVTLGLSAKAMNDISDGLTETADSYQTIDQARAGAIKDIGEDLR